MSATENLSSQIIYPFGAVTQMNKSVIKIERVNDYIRILGRNSNHLFYYYYIIVNLILTIFTQKFIKEKK